MNNDHQDAASGYPADCEPRLSDAQATRITQKDHAPELAEFVAALELRGTVSSVKAALLLEHMIKESTTADAALIADQMRVDQWEHGLVDGETVELVAERACLFLATGEGIKLFNFFVKVFARTNDATYD
jgi:hypothetical protein